MGCNFGAKRVDIGVLSKYVRSRYPYLKRTIDIIISAALIIFLVPVFIFLFIAVKLTSQGPAIFWSERLGYDGKKFLMPKFRSMTALSKVMSREIASKDDIKLTPIGKYLRKSSLDEIPQLWSVLKGDMSLIGPRPLLNNDYSVSTRSNYPEIYSVRPGITGLAQVNGRNFISARNKTRYDTFYAQRACMWLDTKIAFRTFGVVFDTKNVM